MSRRLARTSAIQYTYAWSYGYRDDPYAFMDYFGKPVKENDKLLCYKLIANTIGNISTIDKIIADKLIKDFEDMPQIDISILRVGITELVLIHRELPAVVINEYVEIADEYSTTLAKRVINAILDGVKNDLESLKKPP